MNREDATEMQFPLEQMWIPAPERARHLTPEKRLMIAVLEDALLTLKRGWLRRGEHRKDFRETREWLMSERDTGPFSYLNICDVLDLDADQIRSLFGSHEPCPRSPRRDRIARSHEMIEKRQEWPGAEEIVSRA